MNSEENNNQLIWLIIGVLVFGLIIGYYIGKNKNKDFISLPKNYSYFEESEEKNNEIEKYKECLYRSRSAVEDAIEVLENPEDYGGAYEAIERAKGLLEDTDFCGE